MMPPCAIIHDMCSECREEVEKDVRRLVYVQVLLVVHAVIMYIMTCIYTVQPRGNLPRFHLIDYSVQSVIPVKKRHSSSRSSRGTARVYVGIIPPPRVRTRMNEEREAATNFHCMLHHSFVVQQQTAVSGAQCANIFQTTPSSESPSMA